MFVVTHRPPRSTSSVDRSHRGLKASAELPNLEGNGGLVSGDKVAVPLRGN